MPIEWAPTSFDPVWDKHRYARSRFASKAIIRSKRYNVYYVCNTAGLKNKKTQRKPTH
jgi:hypothetical protein